MSEFKDNRLLCVASTPFQLLGLISIFTDPAFNDYASSDLVVINKFSTAHAIARRIKRENIFCSVICIEDEYEDAQHEGASYLIEWSVSEEKCIRRFYQAAPQLEGKKYDVLVCSNSERFCLEAKRICVPEGYTVFFDDGTGSQSGSVFKTFACFDERTLSLQLRYSKNEIIKKIIKKIVCHILPTKAKLDIRSLWLWSVNGASISRFNKLKVNNIKMTNTQVILDIFCNDIPSGEINKYIKAKYIYLSLPDNISDNDRETEHSLIRQLACELGDSFCVRVHPRGSSHWYIENDISLLTNKLLWEACFAADIFRNTITLLGACSTAQTTPKYLFGREDRVVFLYRLFHNSALPKEAFKESVFDLAGAYSDKRKVFVPISVEQLLGEISYWNQNE